jgi:TldD protein
MFDKLKSVLSQVDADYADARYELMFETRVVFSGRELTSVTSNRSDGYVLRVLKSGGLATVSFTRPEDAARAAKTASENANLAAQRTKSPVSFARVTPEAASFRPPLGEDPRSVSLDEKLSLARRYNDIAMQTPKIATTQIAYSETTRQKHFASTEGAAVSEDLVTTKIAGSITSQDGALTQTVAQTTGGSQGFAKVRNREADWEARTKIAVDLLKAEPVTAGTYPVVLNPWLAGVFTHEAFGHFSEADIIEDNPGMRQRMNLGAKLGSDLVNIVDDPTRPGQLGFYGYDDEGVRARPVQLMKNGVLSGRLHSRRTAAAFGEPLSGHCVAEDFRYAPIIRMGCIFIEPASESRESLLARLGSGLYVADAMGGQTMGENFTFGAQYAYRVKDGKLAGMVRDVNVSGNLYHTLQSIRAVGNDLRLVETGGCGKGQINIRSCYGAPHILVEDVVIGGR